VIERAAVAVELVRRVGSGRVGAELEGELFRVDGRGQLAAVAGEFGVALELCASVAWSPRASLGTRRPWWTAWTARETPSIGWTMPGQFV
jgi:hypothetical protein